MLSSVCFSLHSPTQPTREHALGGLPHVHPHKACRLQPIHPGGATSPHTLLCHVQRDSILQH